MCAVAVLVILAAAAPAPALAKTTQRPFVGIVAEDAFAGTPAYRESTVAQLAQLGVGTARQTLDWARIEPTPGDHRWAQYDDWVRSCAQHGITVLPVVFNAPAWASRAPAQGAKRGTYPPRSAAAFAAFARTAAARYGPGGSFWAANPGIPYRPVRTWQIWNEPNLPVYWQPRPSAKQYVALLRATTTAIRAVDRRAQILTAGLPKSRLGIPLDTYVKQMIRAKALPSFDALAVNPYARTATGVVRFLHHMRKVLDANGARRKGLAATELGWSSQRGRGHFVLGPKGQATAIRRTIPRLWRARGRLKLRGVVYFNYRDALPYPGFKDFWGLHTGLRSLSNQAKPAFTAFQRAIAALR